MKVYTHYYNYKEEAFRWRTLLQFGQSWDIIGSVIMKNPGTAAPKWQVTDIELINNLLKFEDSHDYWYEFSADSSMNCVAELFAFYYGRNNTDQLSGVIQLFNLFYVREGNLFNALKKDKETSTTFKFDTEEDILNYDINHLVMPIYLGFADLAYHSKYRFRAERFFNKAKSLGMNYCHPEYTKNNFIHPLYLMRYGKNKKESIRTKNNFKNNSYNI